MLKRLEHLGIAIEKAEKSLSLWEKIVGKESYKMEAVPSEKVNTYFFDTGNVKVELLEATDSSSVIHSFIAKKGEGLHHLAFEVENIVTAMQYYREQGIRLLNEVPKQGADNKLICFLHPKDCGGVLIELCQEITQQD